jgi:hypothetical protein
MNGRLLHAAWTWTVLLLAAGPAIAQCVDPTGSCPRTVFADGFESGGTSYWAGLPALSDDFEDGNLDGWNLLNPGTATVTVESGALRLEPFQSLWFDGSSAILVWKPVSGNFKVTSTVRTRSVAMPGSPPTLPVRLGGLMARNPDTTNGESYVFVVAGFDVNDLSVEWKTTVDSCSELFGPTWPSGDAELRLCRIDCTFYLYARELGGGAWQLQNTFDRPDLPGVVQVGAMAYANGFPPDVVATFESIDFDSVGSVADCTQ